jgi:hypothetical protein
MLSQTKMEGDDLDTYTATFNYWLELAGWERDAQGTMLMYKRGLKSGLLTKIIERSNPRPNTLDGWQEAARIHHAIWVELKDIRTNAPPPNRWGNFRRQGQRKQRDPDAMDVDSINLQKTGRLSDEDKARLIKENKCFYCKEVGHISRNCPKKKKKNDSRPPAKARTTDTESIADSEATAVTNKDSILSGIKDLSQQERDELYADLCLEDQDF